MKNLVHTWQQLINITLPATYHFPVEDNHCFGRIILDWLFTDCWYNHLQRNKTAVSQLTAEQLQLAINRMNAWLQNQQLLIEDNEASLKYRKKVITVLR